MNLLFYFKKGNGYEVYVQVTEYTHSKEAITILHENNIWKEIKNSYSNDETEILSNLNNYDKSTELKFQEAQNEILKPTRKTVTKLKADYSKLWQNYYSQKLTVERELLNSGTNLKNYSKVLDFLHKGYQELGLNTQRMSIYNDFNSNHPDIDSHEDIFHKVSNEEVNKFILAKNKLIQDHLQKQSGIKK